jgi:hypothetical protein
MQVQVKHRKMCACELNFYSSDHLMMLNFQLMITIIQIFCNNYPKNMYEIIY